MRIENKTDMPSPVLSALVRWAIPKIYRRAGLDESTNVKLSVLNEVAFRPVKAERDPKLEIAGFYTPREFLKSTNRSGDEGELRRFAKDICNGIQRLIDKDKAPICVQGKYHPVSLVDAANEQTHFWLGQRNREQFLSEPAVLRLVIHTVPIVDTSAVETYLPPLLDIGAALAQWFDGPKLPEGELAKYRQPIAAIWASEGQNLVENWIASANGLFEKRIDPATGKIDPVYDLQQQVNKWIEKTKAATRQLRIWSRKLEIEKSRKIITTARLAREQYQRNPLLLEGEKP